MSDTSNHILNVQIKMSHVIHNLHVRSVEHDNSKLQEPEKSLFDEYGPKLKDLTYGSKEYIDCMQAIRPAIDHHYRNNSHHPEYYQNGIKGMSLLDIIEMIVDWKAASERHANGCILKSIEINQKRFGYGDELKQIFYNTIIELGFVKQQELDAFLQASSSGN